MPRPAPCLSTLGLPSSVRDRARCQWQVTVGTTSWSRQMRQQRPQHATSHVRDPHPRRRSGPLAPRAATHHPGPANTPSLWPLRAISDVDGLRGSSPFRALRATGSTTRDTVSSPTTERLFLPQLCHNRWISEPTTRTSVPHSRLTGDPDKAVLSQRNRRSETTEPPTRSGVLRERTTGFEPATLTLAR